MKIPRTIQDIERLIELQTPESIWLDYKESPALSKKKRDEICKDVSAFANSDGGMLIYGVKEEHTFPREIDNGVDTSQISKEWIDEMLATHINPIISGIEIEEVKKTESNSVFIVKIPKSFRGPHQAPDKKYYKRYNARSAPMEHYEIEDVRNRKQIVPPLINFDVQLEGPWIQIVIENTGNDAAYDVKFIFSENFSLHKEMRNGELPHALKNGIKFFPPKRRIVFNFGGWRKILYSDGKHDTQFNVSITYRHPQTDSEVKEDIYFDLKDFLNSTSERDPLGDISSCLKEMNNKLESICKKTPQIDSIAGATGVNLSISTLRNLHILLQGNDTFNLKSLEQCEPNEIIELLDVDCQMAHEIFSCYRFKDKSIEEIPGMTEELLEKIKKHAKKS